MQNLLGEEAILAATNPRWHLAVWKSNTYILFEVLMREKNSSAADFRLIIKVYTVNNLTDHIQNILSPLFPNFVELQPDQINMAVIIWYLRKSELSDLRYSTRARTLEN